MKKSAITYRFLLAAFVVAVALSPTGVARAACFEQAVDFREQIYLSTIGITDATGYSFRLVSGSSQIYIHDAETPENFSPALITGSFWTWGSPLIGSDGFIEELGEGSGVVEYCQPVSPTVTPEPPTATPEPPTATPTEVIVTVTPVPPTPTPTPDSGVILADIRDLQTTNFKWMLFSSVLVVGLLVLGFVRVR
jgi:hypothetical protein